MNNRGQSLISFVLIIPIILMILFMVYDIGNMVLLREKLDNINYIAIDYGLDKIEDLDLNAKLNELIKKNKDDIEVVNISISEGKIRITLEDRLNNKFSLISKFKTFTIKSSYIGYMENDKKVIRKDK